MNRPLIVGIAGALVVLVAILLTFFIDREPDRPLPPTSQSSELRERPTTYPAPAQKEPEVTVSPKTKSVVRSGEKNTAKILPKKSPTGNKVKPSFDIVRVNPQGNAVIAGRAAPNSVVTVRQGDNLVGTVKADKRGEWVLLPEERLSAGTHELTVVSKLPDGTEIPSEKIVVVVVPEQGKDIAGRPTLKAVGSLAVELPKTPDEVPIVLQRPGGISATDLSLDVIDYGQNGDALSLSGRAKPGSEVRVYLDNKYIGRALADEKGIWRLKPGVDIPTGLYRMRVDHVGAGEKTLARVELPFLRAAALAGLPDGQVALVQPGNSLWRLARKTYGSGLRYTEIYEANKGQIRDPDLIYPGQVFVLPKIKKESGADVRIVQ